MVIVNWGCVLVNSWNKARGVDRHHSFAPLASIILGWGIAYPLYPYSVKWWILVIPALDIGNWALAIGLPWAIFTGAFSSAPSVTSAR